MGYSAADYTAALKALLPTGPVWPREPDSVISQVCAILAAPFARNGQRAEQLLIDAFPATTDELLPEWEASLGLPDPCAGESPTVQQRQAQVRARLTYAGGSSIGDITAFALSLGYAVTIDQFTPAVAGRLRAGQPCLGAAWASTWRINAPAVGVTPFRAGLSAAGEPLATFGNSVLRCEIQRIAPAHTILIIGFGDGAASGGIGIGDFAIGQTAIG